MLEGLQRLLWYIQVYEKRFAQEQMERFDLQEKKELSAKSRKPDRAKVRVAEIGQFIPKSYEDMTKGLLSEERFATLTVSLETEQKQLKNAIPEMKASLEATAGGHSLQHYWPVGSPGTGNAGTGIYGLLSSHAEAQEKDGVVILTEQFLYKLPKGGTSL